MNINDIAKLAGVSASTVSKVMNGKDKDISKQTKQKVLKIIEEEQYTPYSRFRDKAVLRNYLIGLIVKRDNRERENIVLNVEKEARRQGYHLVVSYVGETEEMQAVIHEMMRKKVMGFLIDSQDCLNDRKYEDMTVYLNQTKEFDERQKTTFYYRLSEAGKLAAEELIRAGHQKIACITCRCDKSIMDGYRQAMQNNNFSIQPLWTYEGDSIADIEKYGVRQCLSEGITAVICGAKEITCCVCNMMERSRTVIPNDLSIVSVGEDDILGVLGSGITAVDLPSRELSAEAVNCLIDMIQGEKRIEVTKHFSPAVIQRNSIVSPADEKQSAKIVVVGSMNMDVTIEVERIPVSGETQLARKVYVFPGGKGGNQAVGVGKLGGQAYMIGCLGNDMDGKQLFASLTENHVHMDGVTFDHSLPSGKAYINVDDSGESTIAVYQGANRNLSEKQIKRSQYLFENAAYCLLSLEIPKSIAEYTIKFCKRMQTQVILKPSAVETIKEDLLRDIAYFVPNEKELHTFVKGNQTIEEKAEILRELGVANVIVTLGGRGCYFRNKEHSLYFSGTGFEPVDTTGGADSFISALAVYLSEGKDILQALGFAIYASGITVTRYGVQPALPERKAVDIYEDEIYSNYEKLKEDRK